MITLFVESKARGIMAGCLELPDLRKTKTDWTSGPYDWDQKQITIAVCKLRAGPTHTRKYHRKTTRQPGSLKFQYSSWRNRISSFRPLFDPTPKPTVQL